jgi:hypothetical protein
LPLKLINTGFKYYCEICNFKCCKQSNYKTHELTKKHTILTNMMDSEKNRANFTAIVEKNTTIDKAYQFTKNYVKMLCNTINHQ